MKLGILTLPLNNNYGGILQAYALQKVLQKMGHEAIVIDKPWFINLSFMRKCLSYFQYFVKKIFLDKRVVVSWDKKYNEEQKIVCCHTYSFLQNYIDRIEVNWNYSSVKQGDFDVFVVGSDQVWRPKYFGIDICSCAFLSFTKGWDVRRISYAASFGTEEWEYTERQTNECKELIKDFDAVSVRESSAVSLCEKYFGVSASHVLDPTMLLDSADYISLFENAGISQSSGSLMYYILDEIEDKQNLISCVEQSLCLTSFSVNQKHGDVPIEKRIQPPVEKWIRGFYDAEFVVTDSFHACVFSIIFNKPFVVYGNKKRGMARFHSLLTQFGLENRLVTTPDDAVRVACQPIDWNRVNARLTELRAYSQDFLNKALN